MLGVFMRLAWALPHNIASTPKSIEGLDSLLDPALVEQALEQAGVATLRKRRLPLVSISIQNFPGNSVQKFPVDQVLFTAFLRCLKRNESLPVSRMSQW